MKPNDKKDYFWRGEKTQLRPLKIKDAEKKWQEWFDTETRRLLEYQLDLPPVSLDEYTDQLKSVCEFKETTPTTSFAVDSLDGEFVGMINLTTGNPRHGNFTLGISIFFDYQGQGFAYDAIRLILRYGFYELRQHKCSSECLANNLASIKLHEKPGFIKEGVRRKLIYMDGQFHDVVLFGLLKEEFE